LKDSIKNDGILLFYFQSLNYGNLGYLLLHVVPFGEYLSPQLFPCPEYLSFHVLGLEEYLSPQDVLFSEYLSLQTLPFGEYLSTHSVNDGEGEKEGLMDEETEELGL